MADAMLVNRIWFCAITFLMMITLSILTGKTVTAGIITLFMMVSGYFVIAVFRSKKRLNLLEEKCDPQAFLAATERQRKITGKNQNINAYLNIDRAAGLMLLGEFQKAKDVLDATDQSRLSVKNGTQFAYTVNLILCYYALGQTDAAEQLFETQVPLLSPVSPRMTQAMEFLVAERLFYLSRFEESKEKFRRLEGEKLSRRKRLELAYRLAQIEEASGAPDSARQKFEEAAATDSKLWVSAQARSRRGN